jgi:hypothetical protein
MDIMAPFCPSEQVVTQSKSLDAIASELLYAEELEVYSGSRKGRQVVVTKIRQLANDAALSMEQFAAMEANIQARGAGPKLGAGRTETPMTRSRVFLPPPLDPPLLHHTCLGQSHQESCR